MLLYIRSATLLLIVVLAPSSALATLIQVSDVEVTARTTFNTQLAPEKADSDVKSAPLGTSVRAEALVLADGVLGIPFPNVPTSLRLPFASSAADTNGFFGVGVNGFFFRSALPPNALVASGTATHGITNNADFPFPVQVDFFIPAPTLRFFGIGDSFPPGADPGRDVKATAIITLHVKTTHADGSTSEVDRLEYGIRIFRDPNFGILLPIPTTVGGASGFVTRFQEADGSFGFRLSELVGDNFFLGDLGPGETLEFTYDYFAEISTGFGETGVIAAIGDPFNLSTGGGRFVIEGLLPPDPGPGTGIPEPGTLIMVGLGFLVMLGISARRRRSGW